MQPTKSQDLSRCYHILREPQANRGQRPALTVRYSKVTNCVTVDLKLHFKLAAHSTKTLSRELEAALDDFVQSDEKLQRMDNRRRYEEGNIVTLELIEDGSIPEKFLRNGYPFSPPDGAVERASRLSIEEKYKILLSREKSRKDRLQTKTRGRHTPTGRGVTEPPQEKAADPKASTQPSSLATQQPGEVRKLPAPDQEQWDGYTEEDAVPPGHVKPRTRSPQPKASTARDLPPTSSTEDDVSTPTTTGESESADSIDEEMRDIVAVPGIEEIELNDVDVDFLQGNLDDLQGKHPGAESPSVASLIEATEDPLATEMAKADGPVDDPKTTTETEPNPKADEANGDPGKADSNEGRSRSKKANRKNSPKVQVRPAAPPKAEATRDGAGGASNITRVFTHQPQRLGQHENKNLQKRQGETPGQQQQPSMEQPEQPNPAQPQQTQHGILQQHQRRTPASKAATDRQGGSSEARPTTPRPTPASKGKPSSPPRQQPTRQRQSYAAIVQNKASGGPRPTAAVRPGNQKEGSQVAAIATGNQQPQVTLPPQNSGGPEEDPETLAREIIAKGGLMMELYREAVWKSHGSANTEEELLGMITRMVAKNYNTIDWPHKRQ